MAIDDGLGEAEDFVTGVEGFLIFEELFVLEGLLVFFVGVNPRFSAAPRMIDGFTVILALLKIDLIFL